MANCAKCSLPLCENAKFCASCGAAASVDEVKASDNQRAAVSKKKTLTARAAQFYLDRVIKPQRQEAEKKQHLANQPTADSKKQKANTVRLMLATKTIARLDKTIQYLQPVADGVHPARERTLRWTLIAFAILLAFVVGLSRIDDTNASAPKTDSPSRPAPQASSTPQPSQSDSTDAQTPEQKKANAEMIVSGLTSVVNPAHNPYRVKSSSDVTTRTWRCGDTGMSETFRKFIFDMVSATVKSEGLPAPDYSLCFVGHMTASMGQMGVQDRAYVEFFPAASDVEADPMHYDYMLVFFKHVNWQITLWAPQKEPFNLCVKQLSDLEMGTCKSSEPLESELKRSNAEGVSTAGNQRIDFASPFAVLGEMESIKRQCQGGGQNACVQICDAYEKSLIKMNQSLTGSPMLSEDTREPQYAGTLKGWYEGCKSEMR